MFINLLTRISGKLEQEAKEADSGVNAVDSAGAGMMVSKSDCAVCVIDSTGIIQMANKVRDSKNKTTALVLLSVIVLPI